MTMLRAISVAFMLILADGGSYEIGLNGLCAAFGASAALLIVMMPFIAKDFP